MGCTDVMQSSEWFTCLLTVLAFLSRLQRLMSQASIPHRTSHLMPVLSAIRVTNSVVKRTAQRGFDVS